MRVLLIGATENEKIPQALRHDHILFDHIPLPGTDPLLCPEGLYDVAVLLTDSAGKAAAQQLTALLPSLRDDGMSVPLLIVAAHLSARDRILVLANGEVTGIVDARTATKEQIGLMMMGQKATELEGTAVVENC